MRSTAKALLLIGLSVLLAACPKVARPPSETKPVVPSTPAPDLRGAVLYDVDPTASEVAIMVYRGGALARFGHNHVMTSKTLKGRAWVNPNIEKSGFELTFAVNELVVDDPDARRRAGSEFPPEISQSDKDGTRKNMLRAEVLDAEHFPNVTLRSARVSGTLAAPQITARITIKDVSRDVDVPTAVTIDGSRLTATGELDILQTDFGIKPFSIGLGALEVQDRLHVKFKVVAEKQKAT